MHQKIKRNAISIIFFSFLFISLSAQNRNILKSGSVSGRVVDTDNNPLEAVLVNIKGSTIGVVTDEFGSFVLNKIIEGKQTIVVSGLGFETRNLGIVVVAGQTNNISDIKVQNSVNLSEVTVVGKTEARKQQELAFPISVIDVSKVYNTSSSINKLLSNISSVKVREDGGVGSDYTFNINGFSGKQIKFFLDGVPMDNFGSSFDLSNISLSLADRVDVYKGVLPVNLGADALGGAVNIVTRQRTNYIDASYSYGSFNTNKAAFNGAYTDNKGLTFRLNSFFNYSDNDYKVYVPIKDLITSEIIDYRNVKRFHDRYRSGGLRAETGILDKSFADYLLLGLIWSKNNADVQNGATMDAVYGGVKRKSESFIPSIKWKKDDLFVDGLSASAYGAYNYVTTDIIDTLSRKYNWLGESVPTTSHGEGGLNTDSKIKNKEWTFNANINYMINNQQSIMLNNVFSSNRRTSYDKVDPDNESNRIPKKLAKNITGLGWMVTYDRWNMNLFTKMYHSKSQSSKIVDRFLETQRLEDISVNKTNIGYGGAFTYFVFPKLQAKLSYEHSYRLPDSYEIFGDGLYQKENPDLKPEKSNNINVGLVFEQAFGDHIINAEANGIFRYAKDFIHKDLSQGSNPTTGYVNYGKINTAGIESSLKYTYKMFNLGTSITYQDIKDKQKTVSNKDSYVSGSNTNFAYNQRVPNIPYLFGNADAGLHFKNIGMKDSELRLDYSFFWTKSYYLVFPGMGTRSTKDMIPSQTSHDLSVTYSLFNGKYNIGVDCTNIGNRRIYDNYKLQKPGRAFNIKFRYFLSR